MGDVERIWSRARRRGDLPVSLPLLRALGSLALLASLPALGARAWTRSTAALTATLERLGEPAAPGDVSRLLAGVSPWSLAREVLVGALPVVSLLCATALIGGLLQTRGWLVLAARRGPAGAGLATSLLSCAAALAVLVVIGWRLGSGLDAFSAPPQPSDLGRWLGEQLGTFAWACGGLLLLGGALDLWWVRRTWRRRHELDPWTERRERRQTELAPEAKAALRHAHRAALRLDDTH